MDEIPANSRGDLMIAIPTGVSAIVTGTVTTATAGNGIVTG
jgi:hypothetical protein